MRPVALRNDVFYRLLNPRWSYLPLSGEGAARQGGTSLVVFNSSNIRGGGLDVIDPDGDLPQDASSWQAG